MQAMDTNDYTPQKDNINTKTCIYYGVYIPYDLQSTNPNTNHTTANSNCNVFEDKNSVLLLLKQHKRARFKAFNFYQEAVDFSINGCENSINNSTTDYSASKSNLTSDGPSSVGEKSSPFKGPKSQELVILRKTIEKGDLESVSNIIWNNPRYLISNGDTPSILQEGPRYNALHVACKAKNSKIVELILNTVSNIEFVKLLYGDDNVENAEGRAKVFLDLYLNTPDKGLNETPLHFAVKFGAAECVEILVSYPECDKTAKNKYDQTPKMMICDRCDKSDAKLYKKIEQLLENIYYVPVWRAEDNSVPPKIGDPFSPINPPVYSPHPSSPRLEIQAYAGPMNKEGAEKFRREWKTPPRSFKSNTSNTSNTSASVASLRYKDPIKGLEIVGKNLASQYDISWKEYWHFLDCFVDIASEEGLKLLENHLQSKVLETSRSIASISFESSFVERTNSSSISDLCQDFQAFHLSSINSIDNSFKDELDSKISKNFSPYLCLEKACQVFANRFANNIMNAINGNLINILDVEIKQLEIVILSFMNDSRFSNINFKCVHCRLSYLIAQKLYFKFDEEPNRMEMYKKVESLIEICTKSFDCFSSDDESGNVKDVPLKKGTSIKKQLLCLSYSILNHFNINLEPYCDIITEEDCVTIWEHSIPCSCVLYARKTRKNSNFPRSYSRKNNSINMVDPVRKLFYDEQEEMDCSEPDSMPNEPFFTPNTTPGLSDDDNSEFEDADSYDEYETYIEGKVPTKTDEAVFNVLKYSGCNINKCVYPNVYLWKHKITQFSEEEKSSWKKPRRDDLCSPVGTMSTPQKKTLPSTSTPSKSWLRITGVNSPKNTNKYSISKIIF